MPITPPPPRLTAFFEPKQQVQDGAQLNSQQLLSKPWHGFFKNIYNAIQNSSAFASTSAAEAAVFAATGGSVVNTGFPIGHVYRYGVNTAPGSTDMTSAISVAANVCRATGYTLQVPTQDKLIVSGSLDITGINILGLGNPFGGSGGIYATGQFDVLTVNPTSGFAEFIIQNLLVDGGNSAGKPGASVQAGGLVGNIMSLKKTNATHPYIVSIVNCSFVNAQDRCMYIERGGYTSLYHVRCLNAGSHALECLGTDTDACTTIRDYGSSQYGQCLQGYGIKLTDCIACAFRDSILENTFGISLNGITNRSLTFDGVYQENFPPSVNPTGQFFTDNGAGIGLLIQGCTGIGFTVPAFTNWTNKVIQANAGF